MRALTSKARKICHLPPRGDRCRTSIASPSRRRPSSKTSEGGVLVLRRRGWERIQEQVDARDTAGGGTRAICRVQGTSSALLPLLELM